MAEAQLQIEHYWAGALRRAVIDGDVETGSVMAGQSVGMVKRGAVGRRHHPPARRRSRPRARSGAQSRLRGGLSVGGSRCLNCALGRARRRQAFANHRRDRAAVDLAHHGELSRAAGRQLVSGARDGRALAGMAHRGALGIWGPRTIAILGPELGRWPRGAPSGGWRSGKRGWVSSMYLLAGLR